MSRQYLEHYGFVGDDYLEHYGVKGMKWRNRKKMPALFERRRSQREFWDNQRDNLEFQREWNREHKRPGSSNGGRDKKISPSDVVNRINAQTAGNFDNNSNFARLRRLSLVRSRANDLAKKGIYQEYIAGGKDDEFLGTRGHGVHSTIRRSKYGTTISPAGSRTHGTREALNSNYTKRKKSRRK